MTTPVFIVFELLCFTVLVFDVAVVAGAIRRIRERRRKKAIR